MKFIRKRRPKTEEGTTRYKTLFAYLPVRVYYTSGDIEYETRWLEKVTVYQKVGVLGYWINIKFVPNDRQNL